MAPGPPVPPTGGGRFPQPQEASSPDAKMCGKLPWYFELFIAKLPWHLEVLMVKLPWHFELLKAKKCLGIPNGLLQKLCAFWLAYGKIALAF